MFEARKLGYTYPSGRLGVQNVTLTAGPGERVVAMGPNGSGKSTLLRLVSTALPSPPGALLLFGERHRSVPGSVRRRLGVVQDEPVHVDALTGLENARLFGELYGLSREAAQSELTGLFETFGLDQVRNVPVAEYSYGMKRKLLLVEALAHRPDLLVLDEPALALDPPSQAALLALLERRSQAGACTLVATNEPAFAQRLATRVVFLSDGEIVAEGSTAELLESLDGTTRIEIRLTGQVPAGIELKGVAVTVFPDRVVAESRSGTEALPRLTKAVLATGCQITRVDVRVPDLADVFTRLTGLDLRGDGDGGAQE